MVRTPRIPSVWSAGLLLLSVFLLSCVSERDDDPTPAANPESTTAVQADRTAMPPPAATPPVRGPEVTPTPESRGPARSSPSPPATSPPIDLDAGGLPVDAVGPLVVYRRDSSDGTELVLHDAGTDREVQVLVFESDEYPSLAGRRVIVRTTERLWSIALNGTNEITLWTRTGDLGLEYFSASADGSLVAFNVNCGFSRENCPIAERPNHVWIVDGLTGEPLVQIDQTADLPVDFVGTAAPIGWRDDGRLALGGHLHKDLGARDAAVLATDGSVEVIRQLDGAVLGAAWDQAMQRHQPVFVGLRGCGFFGWDGLSRIALTDPDTGAELNALEADAPVLTFGSFRDNLPDGAPREFAVGELLVDEATKSEWRTNVANGRCPSDGETIGRHHSPQQWWVLSEDGTPPRRFSSLLELYREWRGDRLVTYSCGGVEVLQAFQLERVSPSCDPRFHAVEIRLGGVSVGEAVSPRVLGIVEIPAGDEPR